jgi:hypothetical protein
LRLGSVCRVFERMHRSPTLDTLRAALMAGAAGFGCLVAVLIALADALFKRCVT